MIGHVVRREGQAASSTKQVSMTPGSLSIHYIAAGKAQAVCAWHSMQYIVTNGCLVVAHLGVLWGLLVMACM